MRTAMMGIMAAGMIGLFIPSLQASETSPRRGLGRGECQQAECNGQGREQARERRHLRRGEGRGEGVGQGSGQGQRRQGAGQGAGWHRDGTGARKAK